MLKTIGILGTGEPARVTATGISKTLKKLKLSRPAILNIWIKKANLIFLKK
jgi:hypothetical protein